MDRDRFTVVGRETGCHIFEGDGTRPILEENVHVRYRPQRVEFPAEIGEWRHTIEAEEQRKAARGLPHRWNNDRFAVERVVVARTHLAEEPVVTVSLQTPTTTTSSPRHSIWSAGRRTAIPCASSTWRVRTRPTRLHG
ncbi:hypothetical protein [Actinacidiphila soli]|uniref:hypothetical protein n=1 Tax=Actinacidiphila soli TaxID=2487275 RepID=UPI001F0BC384|nr:hypothetical protein [Actinacidiphila soli]